MDPTTIDTLAGPVDLMVIGAGPKVVEVFVALLNRRPSPKASDTRKAIYAIRKKLIKLTPWAVALSVACARGVVGGLLGLDAPSEFAAGVRTGLAIVGMHEVNRAPSRSRSADVDTEAPDDGVGR